MGSMTGGGLLEDVVADVVVGVRRASAFGLMAAGKAARQGNEAGQRLGQVQGQRMPQPGPQADHGEQGEDAKAEDDGHPNPGPAFHARPVAHDRAAGNVEREQQCEHQPEWGREIHCDQQEQRQGNCACGYVKTDGPAALWCVAVKAPDRHARMLHGQPRRCPSSGPDCLMSFLNHLP
jgi:hypothetical protein